MSRNDFNQSNSIARHHLPSFQAFLRGKPRNICNTILLVPPPQSDFIKKVNFLCESEYA